MVAVVFYAVGEGVVIGGAVAIEHFGALAVARGALPTKIAQVHLHRRGAVPRALVLDDAGLDDHPSRRQSSAAQAPAAAAEPTGLSPRPKVQRSQARTFGRAQDLAGKSADPPRGPRAAISQASQPGTKVVFPFHEEARDERSLPNT
ncbi:hypothetical protein [Caulobacter sp. LARHSG274]